jgi:hypothetical protein
MHGVEQNPRVPETKKRRNRLRALHCLHSVHIAADVEHVHMQSAIGKERGEERGEEEQKERACMRTLECLTKAC